MDTRFNRYGARIQVAEKHQTKKRSSKQMGPPKQPQIYLGLRNVVNGEIKHVFRARFHPLFVASKTINNHGSSCPFPHRPLRWMD